MPGFTVGNIRVRYIIISLISLYFFSFFYTSTTYQQVTINYDKLVVKTFPFQFQIVFFKDYLTYHQVENTDQQVTSHRKKEVTADTEMAG